MKFCALKYFNTAIFWVLVIKLCCFILARLIFISLASGRPKFDVTESNEGELCLFLMADGTKSCLS